MKLAVRAGLCCAALAGGCRESEFFEAPDYFRRRGIPVFVGSAACKPLPEKRHGHRVEACTSGVVVLGGSAPDARQEGGRRDVLLQRWDSEVWEARAKMPRGRSHFGSASRGPFVYAIGGGVDRYDAERDEWTELVPDRSLPESHFACATRGPFTYVLGGFPAERSGFYRLDLRDGSIDSLPPPPGFAPTDHLQIAAFFDDRLHVFGGVDAVHTQPRAEHWSFDGTTWHAEPPPPCPVWAKFAAWGRIDDTFVLHDFGEALHYRDGQWSRVAEPGPVWGMAASLALGPDLWLFGGMGIDPDLPKPTLAIYRPGQGWPAGEP